MTKEQLLIGIEIPNEITLDFIKNTFEILWIDVNNIEYRINVERCSREIDGRNSTLESIFNDGIKLLITE